MPDGVVFHRLIDELTHPGEVDDVIELGLDLLAAHPQDGAVEEDVLPPGELGVEARADLQHGGHTPPGGDGARVGSQDLGDALEQRGLARSVVPHEPEGLALGDVEGDVLERPEVLVDTAATLQDGALEGLVAVVIDPEALGDVLNAHGRHG